jgi:hypothetical protein
MAIVTDESDVQQQPSATEGVAAYMRQIVARPSAAHDIVLHLCGWLTDQIIANSDPGDFGALYTLWACIEDLESDYGDADAFTEVAERAAAEWLRDSAASPAAKERWITRWDDWLRDYGSSHRSERERIDPQQRLADLVGWARRAMDDTFAPFAAAQKVMEFVEDDPGLSNAPGVEDLWQAMLAFETTTDRDRGAAEDLIRRRLRSLPTSPDTDSS